MHLFLLSSHVNGLFSLENTLTSIALDFDLGSAVNLSIVSCLLLIFIQSVNIMSRFVLTKGHKKKTKKNWHVVFLP